MRSAPGTLHGLLDTAARRRPDAPAVDDGRQVWSYAQLRAASERFARWLRTQGVAAGDRVVLHAAADRRFAAAVYGCSRAGAACVPLSPTTTPFQLRHILDDARPRLVLTNRPDGLGGEPVPARQTGDAWAEADALASGPPEGGDRSDIALLIYTSGSTGPAPKAVVSPPAQVLFATRMIARRLAYRADDVVFCRLPLSFDYGLYQLFLCALSGAALALRGPESDARLVAELAGTGATVVPLVPSLAGMLVRLAARAATPPPVRLFTNTGEELPPATIAALRARFPGAGIQLMFGTTECKRIAILERDGDLVRPGCVGRPLDGTEVRVVDEHGRPVEPGVTGEIVVRGPHVMAGYWRRPHALDRVFRPDPDGPGPLLHTGDYGHLDKEGYLYFQGRRDQLFKQRGMRTSAAEIEAAAGNVPGVAEAAVLPPTADRGAVLVVAGQLHPADVLRELALRLEAPKVPADCRVLDALPRNANGKIDRVRLRADVDRARP